MLHLCYIGLQSYQLEANLGLLLEWLRYFLGILNTSPLLIQEESNYTEPQLLRLPSGEHTKSYGKSTHFEWENPLFLWPFSIAMLVHQRVFHWTRSCLNLRSFLGQNPPTQIFQIQDISVPDAGLSREAVSFPQKSSRKSSPKQPKSAHMTQRHGKGTPWDTRRLQGVRVAIEIRYVSYPKEMIHTHTYIYIYYKISKTMIFQFLNPSHSFTSLRPSCQIIDQFDQPKVKTFECSPGIVLSTYFDVFCQAQFVLHRSCYDSMISKTQEKPVGPEG